MAGQGLNLGLGDVEALAEALGRNARAGSDLGDPTKAIAEYDDERKQVSSRRWASFVRWLSVIVATHSFSFVSRICRLFPSSLTQANLQMMTLLDGLHRLFGRDTPPAARAIRETGMALLNAIPPLKSQVAAFAMGLQRK